MILSEAQIQRAARCPDCARRTVRVTTVPSVVEALNAVGNLPEEITADDVPDELLEMGAVNIVEVLHDPGCPSDGPITPKCCETHASQPLRPLYSIVPVDLPEDHRWIKLLREIGEL